MRPTHVELRSHRAAVWLALLVTFLLGLLVRWLPQELFERYLVRRTIADQTREKEVGCC